MAKNHIFNAQNILASVEARHMKHVVRAYFNKKGNTLLLGVLALDSPVQRPIGDRYDEWG